VGQADDDVAAAAAAPAVRPLIQLDDWLPDPQVRTRHRRAADADPDALWRAAETVHVRDTPMLGRAVRWRIPGTDPDLAYRDLFRSYPYTVLDEGERWSASGLAGRIWTVRRDYPRLSGPEEFRSWDQPGTVRVLFAHWVEEGRGGRPALVSEARVKAIDRRSALRLRATWAATGQLERLIGGEALRVAARRAARGELG
jgi:hypothetical protein